MTNKKILITIVVALIIITMGVIVLSFIKIDKANNDDDLKTILNNSLEIDVTQNDSKIELISLKAKEEIDKVKIWAFSNPVFLGEFNIEKIDDKYYLEGLEDVLKTKELETGTHRLLVMQNNASLGYFRIYVNDDKSIKFISTSQNNNNSGETSDVDNEENKTEDKSDNKKDQASKATSKITTKIKEDSDQKEIKCTQKKFKNKYSYVFEDENTCVKNGDQIDAWNYFRANNIPATTYGCEKIVDECGNTYYGVYYGNTQGEKFYY